MLRGRSSLPFLTRSAMRYPISNASLDNDGDIAILGRKGSGKTYTAKGLVERLIKRGRRVIVIDPMSIWWGLRIDADGTSPGLPVVVIGGANGDIPLPSHAPEAGAHVAKVLLASNVSAVIDVADMRRPSNLLFVAALLRELYENHRGEAIWIVLEEADIWAPQTGRSAEDQVVFAEVEILARRGRSRGFRLVSITQRPARIHKDVLSQLSTMAVLALPGLHDRKAVAAWMEGVTEDASEVFNTLPTLATGEGWVWTPQQKRLIRERFPSITTFDSSSTPVAGQRRVPQSALSPETLEALRQAFAALAGNPSTAPRKTRLRGVSPTAAGAAIRRLRESRNISQEDLAKLIGSEQKSISRMESGRTFVSTRILERIADKTGCELRVAFVPKT